MFRLDVRGQGVFAICECPSKIHASGVAGLNPCRLYAVTITSVHQSGFEGLQQTQLSLEETFPWWVHASAMDTKVSAYGHLA